MKFQECSGKKGVLKNTINPSIGKLALTNDFSNQDQILK